MINKKIKFLIIGVIIGLISVYIIYNKPHKDYSRLKADLSIKANTLLAEYNINEVRSNGFYLNKNLLVEGIISDIVGTTIIILENGVVCNLDPSQIRPENLIIGTLVSVRGRCIGFDDLLEEVRLDHSFIIQD